MKTAVNFKKEKEQLKLFFLSLFETVFYKDILYNVKILIKSTFLKGI